MTKKNMLSDCTRSLSRITLKKVIIEFMKNINIETTVEKAYEHRKTKIIIIIKSTVVTNNE